jgi:hypothetical protein
VFAIQAQRAGTKISPARKGWVHRQAAERRRCGTTLFVCSLGAKPRDLRFYEPLLETRNTIRKQNCHLACHGVPWDLRFSFTSHSDSKALMSPC